LLQVATAEHTSMVDPRLVLVCSRSTHLGDRSRWFTTLQPRQHVVGFATGSHTLRWVASSTNIVQQVARSTTGSHTLRSSDR